jgi:hypothetical protein
MRGNPTRELTVNTNTTTTAVRTAESGGRVRVRAGFVVGGVLARAAQRQTLPRRDAQRWRPVEAELALGIAARTQCCPSKHPDGYREAVSRRCDGGARRSAADTRPFKNPVGRLHRGAARKTN